jgi:restriction system protein
MEKEARAAHLEAMEAEVEGKNHQLEEVNADLESLLATTLGVDDYVNLQSFRVVADHPPFDCSGHENPIPAPEPNHEPRKPSIVPPEPPQGLHGSLIRN